MYAARHLNRFLNTYKPLGLRLKSNAPRRMSKIVWIDMEMTGLNVRKDKIMEIACMITNNDLDIVAEHPSIIIHQSDDLLNSMDQWCTTTHAKTGLLDECRKSTLNEQRANTCQVLINIYIIVLLMYPPLKIFVSDGIRPFFRKFSEKVGSSRRR